MTNSKIQVALFSIPFKEICLHATRTLRHDKFYIRARKVKSIMITGVPN